MPLVRLTNGLYVESPGSSEPGGQALDSNFTQLDPVLVEEINVTVNGDSDAVPTGLLGYKYISYNGTVVKWRITADIVGDVEFDIKVGVFPSSSSIVASNPPELTSAQTASDSTLTGWTKSIAAGETVFFEISGTPTVNFAQLTLFLRRA